MLIKVFSTTFFGMSCPTRPKYLFKELFPVKHCLPLTVSPDRFQASRAGQSKKPHCFYRAKRVHQGLQCSFNQLVFGKVVVGRIHIFSISSMIL